MYVYMNIDVLSAVAGYPQNEAPHSNTIHKGFPLFSHSDTTK